MVVPVRGHLDSIKRLLKGDRYIGRGSRKYHSMAVRLRCQVSVMLGWETGSSMPLCGRCQERG